MLGAGLLCLSSCGGQTQTEQTPAVDKSSAKNQVIETIMTRRSVRKYLPQPVNRDTMQMILDCGIHAPTDRINSHGQYDVVDNPEFINGITEVYKKVNPKCRRSGIQEYVPQCTYGSIYCQRYFV